MKKLTTAEKVNLLMKHEPNCRHNYILLILLYWIIYDGIEIPESVVEAILGATQPETINRAKRKVIEHGKIISANKFKEKLNDICKEKG